MADAAVKRRAASSSPGESTNPFVDDLFQQELIEDSRSARRTISLWLIKALTAMSSVLLICAAVALVQAVRVANRPLEGWAVTPGGDTYQVQMRLLDPDQVQVGPGGRLQLKKGNR